MSSNNSSDRYPPSPRDPKHSFWQLLKIPIALSVYSAPAIGTLLGWNWLTQNLRQWIYFAFIISPAIWVVWGIRIHSDRNDSWEFLEDYNVPTRDFTWKALVGFPQSGRWAPDSNPVESPTHLVLREKADQTTLRLEYESLISEAQYRDKLLLRTTYFSLGALGLFVGVISTRTNDGATPMIAMTASIVMLSFAIAANSYKDSRDALWDRIGRLENLVSDFKGGLTTFNTVRAMDLRLLNTLSLSSYAVGLTIFMTFLAYSAYLWSVCSPLILKIVGRFS